MLGARRRKRRRIRYGYGDNGDDVARDMAGDEGAAAARLRAKTGSNRGAGVEWRDGRSGASVASVGCAVSERECGEAAKSGREIRRERCVVATSKRASAVVLCPRLKEPTGDP